MFLIGQVNVPLRAPSCSSLGLKPLVELGHPPGATGPSPHLQGPLGATKINRQSRFLAPLRVKQFYQSRPLVQPRNSLQPPQPTAGY
jgi:hypothetical protein